MEADETTQKSFRKYMRDMHWKYLKPMQPAAILSSACIIWKANSIVHPVT
jgi:hypothetical protein